DSMFVEDPALVLDELAVIFPLGAASRRPEAASLAAALRPFRKLQAITLPGTVEGGDILRLGRKLFVGRTARSHAEGDGQLAALVAPYGYEVPGVRVGGCCHLKPAVPALDEGPLRATRKCSDAPLFTGWDGVDVAPAEPHAANALPLSGTVVFPASFPRTRLRI